MDCGTCWWAHGLPIEFSPIRPPSYDGPSASGPVVRLGAGVRSVVRFGPGVDSEGSTVVWGRAIRRGGLFFVDLDVAGEAFVQRDKGLGAFDTFYLL